MLDFFLFCMSCFLVDVFLFWLLWYFVVFFDSWKPVKNIFNKKWKLENKKIKNPEKKRTFSQEQLAHLCSQIVFFLFGVSLIFLLKAL